MPSTPRHLRLHMIRQEFCAPMGRGGSHSLDQANLQARRRAGPSSADREASPETPEPDTRPHRRTQSTRIAPSCGTSCSRAREKQANARRRVDHALAVSLQAGMEPGGHAHIRPWPPVDAQSCQAAAAAMVLTARPGRRWRPHSCSARRSQQRGHRGKANKEVEWQVSQSGREVPTRRGP